MTFWKHLRIDPPPWLPERIGSKEEYYLLWNQRLLGNCLRTWDTMEAVPHSFPGLVMVRQAGANGGGVVRETTVDKLPELVRSIVKKLKVPRNQLQFNECAPDRLARLQGEVRLIDGNIHGRLWERPKRLFGKLIRMREAMRRAKEMDGPNVYFLLKRYLSPASYDDLMELLMMYPGHTVEFTAYTRCLGWARGRNAIIWEVRDY